MADKTEAEGNGASAADTTTTHEDGLIDFPFKLEPLCLLLPHYADCSKVGYVLEGTTIVFLGSCHAVPHLLLVFLRQEELWLG